MYIIIILSFVIIYTLATFSFIARIVCALILPHEALLIRKRPFYHCLWGLSALFYISLWLRVLYPSIWPPVFWERHSQRAEVAERVKAAGGWDAVRQGCIELTRNNGGVLAAWGKELKLPKAIDKLRPIWVESYPENGYVSLWILGVHSSGGHSTPYFGLEVDTSTNNVDYRRRGVQGHDGAAGTYHLRRIKVAEGIYEVY
jgi:hypothetical protein